MKILFSSFRVLLPLIMTAIQLGLLAASLIIHRDRRILEAAMLLNLPAVFLGDVVHIAASVLHVPHFQGEPSLLLFTALFVPLILISGPYALRRAHVISFLPLTGFISGHQFACGVLQSSVAAFPFPMRALDFAAIELTEVLAFWHFLDELVYKPAI